MSAFSTLQSCLNGNISLQMAKPSSSKGNSDPLNCLFVFVEWLTTVSWKKKYFLQLLSVNASESFNGVASSVRIFAWIN